MSTLMCRTSPRFGGMWLLVSWVAPMLVATLAAACLFSGKWSALSKYLAERPALANAGSVVFALERRCPISGIPTAVVRETFGRPDRIDTLINEPQGPGRTEWHYRLTMGGSVLIISFATDSLVSWRAEFVQVDWSREGWRYPSRVPRATVVTYVLSHPGVDDSVKFAVLQGCPAEGMSAAALRAALGRPDFVQPVAAAETEAAQRWVYRLSIEGQALQVDVVQGKVSQWQVTGEGW